ncbi:MAG: YihY/virulence factor BrkB family protein [Candidatus Zixiibacteriota bacterium]
MRLAHLLKSMLNFKRPSFFRSFTSFFRHYFVGLYHRIDEHHIFMLAGGLAFSLFVCIVPFVLIIFSALGIILEASSLEREITSYVDKFIPYETYASYAKQIITSRLDEFRMYKSVAGYVGVIGLLFAASGLFSSMRTILNTVYKVEVGKHVFIAKLRDFGMILLVLLFFLLSTTSLPILEIVKDSADKIELLKFFQLSLIQNVTFRVVSFSIVFIFFFTLYYLIPYEKLGKKVMAISALSATILWEVAKQAFGFYITNFATLKRFYGTYVLLIVIAFWIYYSSLTFILGAEIGQLYRERHEESSVPDM